jgi:transposase
MDMSHGFSADLRWRVIAAISGGLSTRKAAKRFGIGVSTAGKWFRRYRDHGETAARKQGQPPGSKLDQHEAFILGLVDETPDISLAEIAERLSAERCVSAVPSTVWEFFNRRGITFKKRRRTRANSSARM